MNYYELRGYVLMIRLNKNTISTVKFPFFHILLFLIISTFLFLPAQAQTYDPNLNWQVLEGQHFSVIFPGKSPIELPFEYQQIAIKVAEIAEETYQKITPRFGQSFNQNKKIKIILEDFSDSVYGFASSIPHPAIRLNLTAPGFKNFNTKFESWLKIIITHEYTHLAHFDMTNKATVFLRFFLGQIIAPNALQPLWAIEGLAIYNESKWSTGGRLNDTRYDMYLRSDFLENHQKTLDQLQGNYLTSWPGGNAPYIYGQSLIHFIVQKYGEDKLFAISEEFSAFPYLGMNRALKKVLGIDQNDLFKQWENEQSTKYQKQLEEVKQFDRITESQQLTRHHYWVDDPVWFTTKNYDTLLYRVSTPRLYPTIREYNPASKEESILIKRTSGHGTSYSISPDNRFLIYAKLSQYQQYYHYHDLFLYHLESGKQFQISEGMRIKDPNWHPNPSENKIVAVINQGGSNNLILFSLNQSFLDNLEDGHESHFDNISSQTHLLSISDLVYLTDFNEGTQISQPVWSPQNNQIAFSLWHNGYQDICILTLGDDDQIQSIKQITQDYYTDISPNWSADGQYLYFSSDRSNIFNLYAYTLKDQQLFRLTNVTGGAFEPAISPNGDEMAFIQYHATGYELHLTETENLLWKLIDTVDTGDGSLFQGNETENRPLYQYQEPSPVLKDYSPWESFFPTYWTPYLALNSNDLYLGFSSIVQDQLKFYSLPFTLARGMFNKYLYYDFYFVDYAHTPVFSFQWQGETFMSDNRVNNFFDPEHTTSLFQIKANFLQEGSTSQQDSARYFYKNLSLGFQNQLYTLEKVEDDNSEATFRKVNSFIIAYSYNDTESYQASISPETGNAFSLSYQHANQFIGSDITFNKMLFDGRKYFPLIGNNQVLAFRLLAGIATEGLDKKEQFQLGGNANQTQLSSVNSPSFPLRGFPASAFSGNHLLTASLEYRFPIKTVENKIGFDWASIFLERISGTLFIDAGQAWEGNYFPSLHEYNISLGAELNFKLNLAHNDPFTLTVGVGKALTQNDKFRFYTQMGISF